MSSSYTAFASDLPPDRIVFRSAEENEETMGRCGVTQETRQVGKGPFRCEMAVTMTPLADLYADRFNRAFSMRLESPPGMVGLLVLRSAGGSMRACGVPAANERLLVIPDGCGVDIASSGLGGSDALTMPKARFAAMAEVLCPTTDAVLPEQTATIQGDTGELQALRNGLLHCLAHPDRDPRQEGLSNLLATTIAWEGTPRDGVRPERLSVGAARARIAKLAQEHIEEEAA